MGRSFVWQGAVWLVAAVGTSGCGAGNALHEYDYRDQTVSIVSDIPRRPEVLSGSYFMGRSTGDPLRDILRMGARVAREVEARAIQERLDSAASLIDVGYVLEDNALERSARYLGADPAPGEQDANYLLEVIVLEYGIDAEAWDAAAHFFIEADAALLHTDSGTEVWRAEIEAQDQIGPAIYGRRSAVRDIVTAAMLADLTVEEIVVVMESLADFSARIITDQLRDDLREARRR